MQPASNTSAEMLATVRRFTTRRWRPSELRARLNTSWDAFWADEPRRARTMRRAKIAAGPLAIILALSLYFIFRPYPQPDYSTAGIDEIFNFTLLQDEFNRLSIDKRLELLALLRDRIEKMGAGESALLAAFAAGIGGQARDQLAENISRLMVDIWDKHAEGYPDIPEADRPMYLETTFVEIARAMETVAGETPRQNDSELIAEVKSETKRGEQEIKDGRGPGGRELGRVFDILDNGVGSHANPAQRARGQVMMRDMMRQLRGQDLKTGKPLR
jgi:hypothetical protein